MCQFAIYLRNKGNVELWTMAGSTVPTQQTLVSQPHHALFLASESVFVTWSKGQIHVNWLRACKQL